MGTIENLMGTPKTNLLTSHSQEISMASCVVLFPSSEHFHAKSAADSGDECISCKNKMHVIKAQLVHYRFRKSYDAF
jgi:hypothetical protein